MPDTVLCRQHCWLNHFSQIENAPLPKFALGQFVVCRWFSEERQAELVDRGQIIGLTLNTPHLRSRGWWYIVRLSESPSCPWLPVGHIEEIHESELEVDASATH